MALLLWAVEYFPAGMDATVATVWIKAREVTQSSTTTVTADGVEVTIDGAIAVVTCIKDWLKANSPQS